MATLSFQESVDTLDELVLMTCHFLFCGGGSLLFQCTCQNRGCYIFIALHNLKMVGRMLQIDYKHLFSPSSLKPNTKPNWSVESVGTIRCYASAAKLNKHEEIHCAAKMTWWGFARFSEFWILRIRFLSAAGPPVHPAGRWTGLCEVGGWYLVDDL